MATKKKAKKTAKKPAAKKAGAGRPTRYDQGKEAAKTKFDAAVKRIQKQDKKPSVTSIARDCMGAGWDDASVLKLLKAVKIKHGKDAKAMSSLRRALARAGDISIGGKAKAKSKPAAKPAAKKTTKKKVAKKAAKKAPAKKKGAAALNSVGDDDFDL